MSVRPAAPLGSKAQSPRPPVVSGAAANVTRSPAGLGRAPMMTQPGMGSFGPPVPAAAPPPVVSPVPAPAPAPAPAPKHVSDLPPWDDGTDADAATTVGAQAAIPVRDEEERAPETPVAPVTAPQGALTAPPAASDEPLSAAAREEIRAIVRAVVEEALGPVGAQQRALLARLERAEAHVERIAATPVAPPVAQAAPALHAPPPAPAPSPAARAAAPAPAPQNPFLAAGRVDPISLIPVASIPVGSIPVSAAPEPHASAAVHIPPSKVPVIDAPATPRTVAAPQRLPGGSIPPTGLGVIVTAGPRQDLPLPSATGSGNAIDLDLPDFGKRRRVMGRVIVVLLLLGVAAAVVATILSRA